MKILFATNGSGFSRTAVEKGCQIVTGAKSAEMKIAAVYQAYIPPGLYAASVQYLEEFDRALEKQAEGHVAQAAAIIRERFTDEHLKLTMQVSMGAPARIILETAISWEADLIVIGTHGRNLWERTMIGSVSDSIIHQAPCSVLVVGKLA